MKRTVIGNAFARLKISGRRITEIETMVTRNRNEWNEGALFSIDALTKPQPDMNLVPDALQKMSRSDLIRIAEFYPAGLKVGGSFDAVHAPFAPDRRLSMDIVPSWNVLGENHV